MCMLSFVRRSSRVASLHVALQRSPHFGDAQLLRSCALSMAACMFQADLANFSCACIRPLHKATKVLRAVRRRRWPLTAACREQARLSLFLESVSVDPEKKGVCVCLFVCVACAVVTARCCAGWSDVASFPARLVVPLSNEADLGATLALLLASNHTLHAVGVVVCCGGGG